MAPFWGLDFGCGGAFPPALHPASRCWFGWRIPNPPPRFWCMEVGGLDAPTWFPVAAGRGWKKGMELRWSSTPPWISGRIGRGEGELDPLLFSVKGLDPTLLPLERVVEGLDPTWLPLEVLDRTLLLTGGFMEGLDPILLPMVGAGSLFPGLWRVRIPSCSLMEGLNPTLLPFLGGFGRTGSHPAPYGDAGSHPAPPERGLEGLDPILLSMEGLNPNLLPFLEGFGRTESHPVSLGRCWIPPSSP